MNSDTTYTDGWKLPVVMVIVAVAAVTVTVTGGLVCVDVAVTEEVHGGRGYFAEQKD